MRTCGTPCHKNSFLHKIYMTFCATTLNIVTVACSFHPYIICFLLSDGIRMRGNYSPFWCFRDHAHFIRKITYEQWLKNTVVKLRIKRVYQNNSILIFLNLGKP
jgi:hypothetical protein